MKAFFLTLLLVAGCQGAHDEVSTQGSELNFLRMGNPKSCSVKHALEPEFRVCFKGVSSQKIQDYTIKGVHEYLDVARQLSGRVTNNVVVSCKSPALTVNIRSGSGTSTGGSGRVNTYTSKNYGTILHELGHAFSCLGDTYVGRSAGKCKSGQPESIMCWGAYGKHQLYPDDIAGIKATFRMVHPDAVGDGAMPRKTKPQRKNNPLRVRLPGPLTTTETGCTITWICVHGHRWVRWPISQGRGWVALVGNTVMQPSRILFDIIMSAPLT